MTRPAAILLAALTVLATAALASPARAVDPEIGALVMSQTQTRIGREFYRAFSCNWVAPEGLEASHVLVQEQADPRWGSLVSIFVDDRLVWRKILGTRSADVEKEAAKAITFVAQQMLRWSLARQLEDSYDLADDGY
jgi:hypothetical protein